MYHLLFSLQGPTGMQPPAPRHCEARSAAAIRLPVGNAVPVVPLHSRPGVLCRAGACPRRDPPRPPS